MIKLGNLALLAEIKAQSRPQEREPVKMSAIQRRQAEMLARVTQARRDGTQELGFSARPFSLCSIPYDQPEKGQLEYTRRNGKYVLRVVADPKYGLPWGMDQSVPFWVATKLRKRFGCARPVATATLSDRLLTFKSIAEILDDLGMPKTGGYYDRLEGMFQRTFGATIYWGRQADYGDHSTWAGLKLSFFDGVQITRMKNYEGQEMLPEMREENVVLVSEMFFNEIINSSLPFDMEVFRDLRNAPGLLHFFMSLSHRCYNARGVEEIPLFGPMGLRNQLGTKDTLEEKSVKQQIKRWLERIKVYWPECPAFVEGDKLIVSKGAFVVPKVS
jgi:hypothetical protein